MGTSRVIVSPIWYAAAVLLSASVDLNQPRISATGKSSDFRLVEIRWDSLPPGFHPIKSVYNDSLKASVLLDPEMGIAIADPDGGVKRFQSLQVLSPVDARALAGPVVQMLDRYRGILIVDLDKGKLVGQMPLPFNVTVTTAVYHDTVWFYGGFDHAERFQVGSVHTVTGRLETHEGHCLAGARAWRLTAPFGELAAVSVDGPLQFLRLRINASGNFECEAASLPELTSLLGEDAIISNTGAIEIPAVSEFLLSYADRGTLRRVLLSYSPTLRLQRTTVLDVPWGVLGQHGTDKLVAMRFVGHPELVWYKIDGVRR